MEVVNLRVVSKSAQANSGELFVMMDGMIEMPKWFAVNLATLPLEPGLSVSQSLAKEWGVFIFMVLPVQAVRRN